MSGFWQWASYLRRRAELRGRQVIYINIDESSILQSCPNRKGICLRRRYWPSKRLPAGPSAKHRRRGAVSLVAMISSKGSLQRKLPQIFLSSTRVLSKKDIQHVPPGSVKFWRRRSSWVNKDVMVDILKELSQVLPRSDSVQYVVLLDCCAVHLSEPVLREFHRQSWWPLYVPPHCTALLQPLDCTVFGPLKESYRKGQRLLKAQHQDGYFSARQWVDLLSQVTQNRLCETKWTNSFFSVGVQGHGASLNTDLQHLQLAYPSTGEKPAAPGLLPQGREALMTLLLDCPRQRLRL